MKFMIHARVGIAIIVGVCCLATQRIGAQGSSGARASSGVKDPSGIQSVSLQDALSGSGSVPVRRVTNVVTTAHVLTSMGMNRGYRVAVNVGVIPPNARFVTPQQDMKNPQKGRFTYYFNDSRWVDYRKDMKAGQVVLRPPPPKPVTIESGPSGVVVLTVWFPPQQSSVPVESGALQTTNILEYLDKHPLRAASFAESNLLANSLFLVKALQLQPGATFNVPFPHRPIYMLVLRGPISINGVQMEKDRIIAAQGPGPRSLIIGNPGQQNAAVMEVEIVPKAKPFTKPAKLAPPQEK